MQIINAMGGQIEKQQDNNGCLSYWLSNTVTLLYLLQRNIKPASGGAYNARLRSPGSRSAPTNPLFWGLGLGLSPLEKVAGCSDATCPGSAPHLCVSPY